MAEKNHVCPLSEKGRATWIQSIKFWTCQDFCCLVLLGSSPQRNQKLQKGVDAQQPRPTKIRILQEIFFKNSLIFSYTKESKSVQPYQHLMLSNSCNYASKIKPQKRHMMHPQFLSCNTPFGQLHDYDWNIPNLQWTTVQHYTVESMTNGANSAPKPQTGCCPWCCKTRGIRAAASAENHLE